MFFGKKGRLVNIGIADVWIAIALNRPSGFGKIQYTKTSEHLCVLNKVLQLVLHVVRVLTWSCYMIGVILIFQSLLVCLHHICLFHTNKCLHANKLLITVQPIRNLQTPVKWTKGVLIAGTHYPLSPIPSLFPVSFLSPTPFDACYAG